MTTGAITSGALDSTLVYHNRALKGQWLHLQPDDLALAVVAGTVRTTSHLPEAGGSEFHPQGVPTGKSFPAAADVYDGASDGIHIYAWRWHEAKLVRFDLDWGNPVVVFSLPMETFSKAYMGVTYDPVTKSVWLSPWIDLKGRLDNYSLDGQLMRSFPTADPEAKGAGLAMDYSDDTLWFFNWTQNRYEQYSRAGTLLSTLGGMTRIYGAEFDAPSGAARGQVFAWGSNFNGQTNVPPGLDDVVEVAAGRSHSLARRADGSVVAWGAGAINNGAAPDYGQSIVPSNATNVAQITAGYYHSAALRRDGRVVVWGGIDASTRNAPSGATNLAAIDSWIYRTLALRADGNFLAWGNNHPPPPFGVPGATAIAAGANHNLALKPDGMLVGWGSNTYGTTNIPPSATNIVAVDAGSFHNLALRSDGKVIAWGWNFQGQTNVPQGLANVVAIAAGEYSSMALRANGSVAVWGQSIGGVPPGLANVVAIAAGTSHALAVVNDGSPVVLRHPVEWVAAEGGEARFAAAAVGKIPLSYQWQRNGVDIPGAESPTLVLPSVGATNSGWYRVVVRNAVWTNASTAAELVLGEPPKILQDPTDVYATQGGSATFVVEATGWPTPSFQWRLDGKDLPNKTNATLVLNNVQSAQFGLYTAVARNSLGSATSLPARLALGYPPSFEEHPQDILVPSGADVAFTFKLSDNTTPPAQWSWFKNSMALPGTGVADTSLILTNVSHLDSGSYYVRAQNAFGSASSRSARLSVFNPSIKLLPLALTGWNYDMVVEKGATGQKQVADDAIPIAFFESGFKQLSTGLPPNRVFNSASTSNVLFALEPYELKNALILNSTPTNRAGTLALDQPRKFKRLSIAATSYNGHLALADFRLNFSDGSSSSNIRLNAQDISLGSGSGIGAIAGLDYVLVYKESGIYKFLLHRPSPPGMGMWATEVDLTSLGLEDKFLQSVAFTNRAANPAAQTLVFAVSGEPNDAPPPPFLSIAIDPASLAPRLALKGEPGRSYTLQSSTNLTRWLDAQSILLTNQEQTLPLPAPQASQFLRVRVD